MECLAVSAAELEWFWLYLCVPVVDTTNSKTKPQKSSNGRLKKHPRYEICEVFLSRNSLKIKNNGFPKIIIWSEIDKIVLIH